MSLSISGKVLALLLTLGPIYGTVLMYRAFLNMIYCNRHPDSNLAHSVMQFRFEKSQRWSALAKGSLGLMYVVANTAAIFATTEAASNLILFAGTGNGNLYHIQILAITAFLITVALTLTGLGDLKNRFLSIGHNSPFYSAVSDGILVATGAGAAITFIPGQPISALIILLIDGGCLVAVRLLPRLVLSNKFFFPLTWRKGISVGFAIGSALVFSLRTGVVSATLLNLVAVAILVPAIVFIVKAYIATALRLAKVFEEAGLSRLGRLGRLRERCRDLFSVGLDNLSRMTSVALAVICLTFEFAHHLLGEINSFDIAIGVLVASLMLFLGWKKIPVVLFMSDWGVNPSQEPPRPGPNPAQPMAFVGHLSPDQEVRRTREEAQFKAVSAAISKASKSDLEEMRKFLIWAKKVNLAKVRFGRIRKGWPVGVGHPWKSRGVLTYEDVYLTSSGVIRFKSGERYGDLESGVMRGRRSVRSDLTPFSAAPPFANRDIRRYLLNVGMLDAWQHRSHSKNDDRTHPHGQRLWGSGPFENDDASNFIDSLREVPANQRAGHILAALRLPDGHIAAQQALTAVAAAGLIAVANGMPADIDAGLYDDISKLAGLIDAMLADSRQVSDLVRAALLRVTGVDSEWLDLWDDADQLARAKATLSQIRASV